MVLIHAVSDDVSSSKLLPLQLQCNLPICLYFRIANQSTKKKKKNSVPIGTHCFAFDLVPPRERSPLAMHSVMTTGSSSASLVGCSLLAPHRPTLQEAPSKQASEDFGTVSSFSCWHYTWPNAVRLGMGMSIRSFQGLWGLLGGRFSWELSGEGNGAGLQ